MLDHNEKKKIFERDGLYPANSANTIVSEENRELLDALEPKEKEKENSIITDEKKCRGSGQNDNVLDKPDPSTEDKTMEMPSNRMTYGGNEHEKDLDKSFDNNEKTEYQIEEEVKVIETILNKKKMLI